LNIVYLFNCKLLEQMNSDPRVRTQLLLYKSLFNSMKVSNFQM
jgi:hypothetical protein